MARQAGRMRILIDEDICVKRLASFLNYCSKSLGDVEFLASTERFRGRPDSEWMVQEVKEGDVIITGDRSMSTCQGTFENAQNHGLKVFMLDPRISQQTRWHLVGWVISNMPAIIRASKQSQVGSLWFVDCDCRLTPVRRPRTKKRRQPPTTRLPS